MVDRGEECRERLSRARRCEDEDAVPRRDRGPAELLRARWRLESRLEPGPRRGIERCERIAPHEDRGYLSAVEIGLGIDVRFDLKEGDHRAIAHEAAKLGYESLWTSADETRHPFQRCAWWHRDSGLQTGIAVVPVSAWSIETLASVSKETVERNRGEFTLGIGAGRERSAPIRVMRDAIETLRPLLPGVQVYLGALGPQMLNLAGERYDGVALNWCTVEQVRSSRDSVSAAAKGAGRDPAKVAMHEYIRICIDHDAETARIALARTVMSYALARPGADLTKGYRGHFSRMGFDETLRDLEARRADGASEDELARMFPAEVLRRIGYWGPPNGARDAFLRLSEGLDIAIVRVVASRKRPYDLQTVRIAMAACAPRS